MHLLRVALVSLLLAVSFSFERHVFSRRILCAGSAVVAGCIGVAFPVLSAEDKEATKAYENCLSKCMYQETRPPPIGSKAERLEAKRTRAEILSLCKKGCAVTEEQKAKARSAYEAMEESEGGASK